MKAVTISKNGGPEVLELKDIKLEDPKSGEVLIKNKAIGLNYIDTYHRSGLYPVELPSNIGIEGAGVIEKIGSDVKDFNVGDKIGLLLAAANRDPKHFSKPELFDPFIERKINLSLGAGLHFCLGAHLARLELEIALVKLITKFPTMEISSTPIYQDNFHFYGLKELVLKTTK